jgi:hypothetical protein
MRRIRFHLSYANVTATLALFVALGGGAYAAATLPRDSVGTAQLQPHAVVLSKIAPRTRALLRGRRGRRGKRGATGAAGAPGPQGPPGPTAAAVSVGGGDPSANPTSLLTSSSATLTTTTPGRVLVLANARVGIGCSPAQECNDKWGVYLDGAPVPSTAFDMYAIANGTDSEQLAVMGVSPVVPAGTHTIVLRDDKDPNVFSASMSHQQVGGVALGP